MNKYIFSPNLILSNKIELISFFYKLEGNNYESILFKKISNDIRDNQNKIKIENYNDMVKTLNEFKKKYPDIYNQLTYLLKFYGLSIYKAEKIISETNDLSINNLLKFSFLNKKEKLIIRLYDKITDKYTEEQRNLLLNKFNKNYVIYFEKNLIKIITDELKSIDVYNLLKEYIYSKLYYNTYNASYLLKFKNYNKFNLLIINIVKNINKTTVINPFKSPIKSTNSINNNKLESILNTKINLNDQ